MARATTSTTELRTRQPRIGSQEQTMSMMRIAVAGTGGLACLIARRIDEDTGHHVMFLSRSHQPGLVDRGFHVAVVDYADPDGLKFALKGIDTVVSTVTGQNQISLIKAAVGARVRRFAPAEFEGLPRLRPTSDPLDRHRTEALRWLQHFSQNINYTVFVCGVFYERFQPRGMAGSRIGASTGISGEGDYILDCRQMSAQAPMYNASNQHATLCMTSAQDVARFVTKAIDLPTWPAELRMHGERLTVRNLVLAVQQLKHQNFDPLNTHTPATLRSELLVAAASGDRPRGMKIQALIATAEGRYDFTQPDLNSAFPDIVPERFASWFRRKWDLQ